ncbi:MULTISPECIES: ShlB/FhaC/HecB family hemolysin secretion/activation protein [unclassified Acinetobacter]|uniref:ShlB/FhaC/HecB family hemolysin secretion/activation protein n=1 Tax=unclassified Acinetobacter TaxID=196816 RepID=UPI0029350DF5|nr:MULTISPECIES: ShlB/FhaC/HecB family hemolysin secretion/activation protein [unclassified Acinetobacter]WOE32916.1 ShlB/FhaC/HecB family hemolysin secretion/activation protein [Acinetobacter sp. SAAs470]WOE38393.1 ShlB/FhaC/HecB family hemolysin secretion/activation protein [Acinetobacter sp. SAAs474]
MKSRNRFISQLAFGAGVFMILTLLNARKFDPAVDGLIRNQQRQAELKKITQPQRDVLLDQTQNQSQLRLQDLKDQHCFPIHQVQLNGEMNAYFEKYLKQALKELAFSDGICMGEQRINLLMSQTQNIIIGQGYTTTRILVAPQNLSSGILKLTVIPGLLGEIKIDQQDDQNTHAGRIQYAKNIFPLKTGDVLNLRALEQGLENLKRVPTVEADIEIVPASAPNQSNVIVKWKQRTIPVRVTLSVDDAGSHQTGKYQGNVTLSLDNPLFRSDLFYVTFGQNLADQQSITDQNGTTVDSGSNNYAIHYSIPYKNWLVSANVSRYQYDQAVAAANNVYDYNGLSHNQDLSLTRLLYRDASKKTTATLKGWHRTSKSFIDDAELTVQRRDVAGWQLDFNHRQYIQAAVLDLGLGYRRGTGAFGALSAIEEAFDEGTSRMKIWTVDASLQVPFRLDQQNFSYSSSFHGQYNQTPLSVQDRISIGGRYTVRGFDGDLTLSADRGFYWRNDLATSLFPSHQFYMALDAGHVDGQSAQWLLGKTLVGGAMGLRGQFKVGGTFYYDAFIGKPLKKPEYFQNFDLNYGFSASYSF